MLENTPGNRTLYCGLECSAIEQLEAARTAMGKVPGMAQQAINLVEETSQSADQTAIDQGTIDDAGTIVAIANRFSESAWRIEEAVLQIPCAADPKAPHQSCPRYLAYVATAGSAFDDIG